MYYRYLGLAYAALGQWDEAVGSYQRLLKLSPGAADVRQRLAEWQAQKR
ncbi:MAG: tetratricopeptide repeat protein [Acidobacteriia bacterium]|nr:tetratricopeptide repeat protein [Terriglobia bacterium]